MMPENSAAPSNEQEDVQQPVTELPVAPLSCGSFGPGVERLQRALIQLGYMDQSAIRWRAGFYGPRTTEAISQVAAAMRSQDAEAVGGTFTNDVREHMLKQLRGSNVESSAAAAVPSDDVVAAPEEEKSEAASDLAVPEEQLMAISSEEQAGVVSEQQ